MTNPELVRLETAIDRLSFTEQLWLMDRLYQRIRDRTPLAADVNDGQLAAMAEDPAIQIELEEIEREFAVTEHDGMAFHVLSLDPRRFPPAPAGKLVGKTLRNVEDAVRYCLGL